MHKGWIAGEHGFEQVADPWQNQHHPPARRGGSFPGHGVAGAVVASAPLGLHPLEEVAVDLDAEFGFPLADEGRHGFVQEFLVPMVHDFGPLGFAAAGAHGEGDALVIDEDAGFGFPLLDIQEVAPPPEIVTLPGDELPGCFPCLPWVCQMTPPSS